MLQNQILHTLLLLTLVLQFPEVQALPAVAKAAKALGLYDLSLSSPMLVDFIPQLLHLCCLHLLFVALGMYRARDLAGSHLRYATSNTAIQLPKDTAF